MADFNFSGDRSGARMDDLLTQDRLFLTGRFSSNFLISGSTEEWITEEISLEENTYYLFNLFLWVAIENTGDLVLDITSSGITESRAITLASPSGDTVANAIGIPFISINMGNAGDTTAAYTAYGCFRTGTSPTFRISYDPTRTTGDLGLHHLVMEVKKATDTYQLP